MGLKKLYSDIYKNFQEKYAEAKGYHFHESTSGSASPPPVSFRQKLQWWTLNRPRRLQAIRHERDRRQQEILELPPHTDFSSDSSSQ